jgi:hypothetical protein
VFDDHLHPRSELAVEGSGVEEEEERQPDADELEAVEEEQEEEVYTAVEEDEAGDASLDQLLEGRAASPPGNPEGGDEETDIMALASERDLEVREPIQPRVTPLVNRKEFVCARCHLVKPRVQLVDAERGLCRDCA